MIHYILQIIGFQLLFLITYDLFLKKETFFNWNRAYLLLTPILSFLLPIFKFDFIRNNVPETYSIQLPEVLIIDSPMQYYQLPEVIIGSEKNLFSYTSLIPLIGYVYYIGIGISLLLFIFKVIKIVKLRRSGTKVHTKKNITLVSLPNTNTAFSFFNTIYIGDALSKIKKANVIIHEKIHITEYHSIDLIIFEILRILFWFNPLIYVYQRRIAMLQEYIADAKAVAETNKKEYYQDLLSQIFQTEKISFINTFFNHSLIKNRIVMLQKSKSKKIVQLKYLLLLPVVCTMLIYSSCSEDSSSATSTANNISITKSTPLIKKIDAVLHQAEIQGGLSTDEEKALKRLALLTINGADVSDPLFADVRDNAGIPFGVIENVPVYPGCENLSKEETKNCFSQKIKQLVASEFNTKIGDDKNLTGQQRIYVQFKINTEGNIIDAKARGSKKILEEEALRVINSLPKMQPGKQDGVAVSVMYTLPIVFEIKE